jgi:hypothetical protein
VHADATTTAKPEAIGFSGVDRSESRESESEEQEARTVHWGEPFSWCGHKTLESANRFSVHCMGQRCIEEIISKTPKIIVPYRSSNLWQSHGV